MNLQPRKLAATAALGIAAVALMAQYGGSGDPWWEAGSGRAMPMFSTFHDATGDISIVNMEGPIATRARAPYFSNGQSKTLAEVVDFYDTRFDIRLSGRRSRI